MQGSMSLPLFKCFLQWQDEAVWWGKGKTLPSGAASPFLHGKSATSSPCRQVSKSGESLPTENLLERGHV